jgi:septal ring factor EnvC (AmiA/AmiB activator)
MSKSSLTKDQKLNIDGQWFYRGNVDAAWFARASRLDGSMAGICELVPAEYWPILEKAALAVELEERVKELEKELRACRERYKDTHHLAQQLAEAEARIAELEAQLKTAYGYGNDKGAPPWMK